MIKAGLIGAVIGFIYIMSLTLFSPFCTLCLTPFLGISVGYIAGGFDKPLRAGASLRRGGIAGGITSVGVIVGQILATVVNGILVTNSDKLPIMMREMGLSQFIITNSNEYWQATITVNSFCGIFNLALIVGLGAMGGMIWFQRHNKRKEFELWTK
jgi:MFS family permease